MKTWEKPDMITLDVNETAAGGGEKTVPDKEYSQRLDDGRLLWIQEFPSGDTGRE